MRRLRHPNIIRLVETFESPEQVRYFGRDRVCVGLHGLMIVFTLTWLHHAQQNSALVVPVSYTLKFLQDCGRA